MKMLPTSEAVEVLACLLIGSSTLPAEDQNSRQIYDKSSSTCNWFVKTRSLSIAHRHLLALILQRLIQLTHLSRWFRLYKSLNILSISPFKWIAFIKDKWKYQTLFSIGRLCPLPSAEYGCLWGWILHCMCLILLHSYSAAIPLAAGLELIKLFVLSACVTCIYFKLVR